MTDTTHTSGPWRVLHKTGVFPMDSDCWTIGTAEQHRKEHEANARLMAAAPDLLAALQILLEACEQRANTEGGDFGSGIGPAAALATAAIARATCAAV